MKLILRGTHYIRPMWGIRNRKLKLFLIVGMTLFVFFDGNGQKLIWFKYQPCEENPHVYKMNTMINNTYFSRDSSIIEMTWLDNCAFEPKFFLRNVKNDTIYFSYENNAEDRTMCGCAFQLRFSLKGLNRNYYNIKVNDRIIEKNTKRYQTEGYIVEYYPGVTDKQQKLREVFFENGKVVVEVFYGKNGEIVSEKFYNERWGFFLGERKF